MKEKILREIDRRVANAYELPFWNSKKKYWQGWDDALQEIYELVEEIEEKDLLADIRAEIERRMDKHWDFLPDADSPEDDWTHNELCELGAYKELEHLEKFLDDIEKQQVCNNCAMLLNGVCTHPKGKCHKITDDESKG